VLVGLADAAPIERLILARDAFALAEPEAAALLREHAYGWGVAKEVVVFDGSEAEWLECYRVLQGAEIWQHLGPWIIATRPGFGPTIAPRFVDAAMIEKASVSRYRAFRQTIAASVRALVPGGTGLIIPTTLGPALPRSAPPEKIGRFYRLALPLNAVAGHPGLPQVTIPVVSPCGYPLGLSIVGAPLSDPALLAFARSVCDRKRHD
jgi:amidase